MINKSKWIYNYNNLEPNNQLLVAEAIKGELKDNEEIYREDEYDIEKSRIIREFFNKIGKNIEQSEELKKCKDIIDRYDNLSEDNKKRVNDEVLKVIEKYLEIQEQEDKKKICKQEGHNFGKWNKYTWTETHYEVIDHQHYPNYPIKKEDWERICKRCGYVEIRKTEPKELVEARKEKSKKARIKKLELEIKKLKDEQEQI